MGLTVEVGWLDTTPALLWTLEDPVLGEIDSASDIVIDGFGVGDGITWSPVSPDDLEVHTTRGRPRELDDVAVGEATIVLRNDGRDYDPFNTASPNYPGVCRGRPVRIHDGTETAWVFTGVIDDVIVEYFDQKWSTATLKVVELLAQFGAAALDEATPPSELSGARVSRLADAAGWTNPRSIDTGWVTCGTQTVVAGTNALNALNAVARAELGRVFVAGDGTLRFRDYPSSVGTSSVAVFDNTAGAGIRFTGVRLASPAETQAGRVQATAAGSSNPQIAAADTDAGWWVRTVKLDDLPVVDDATALTVAQQWAAKLGPGENRISWLEVTMSALSAGQRTTVLNIDLGDVITVRFTPPGGGDSIEQSCAVEAIENEATGPDHFVRFSLSKIELVEWWTLEDSRLGEIDAEFVLSFG